jgi:iron(III) transport system substrate-binding protein
MLPAVALALAACGRPHEVTVYTSLDPEVTAWAEQAFGAARPDVAVRFESVASGTLLERLRSEREDPTAQVVWGAPSWTLAAAAAEGLLAPGAPSWAASLPEALRDPEGRWTGSLVDPIVLAFDHEALSRSRAPRDWIDLFHPRFAGEVLVPEPGTDDGGSVLLGAHAAASLEAYGDVLAAIDWFRRLDGQSRRYEADEEVLLRHLGRGDGSVAAVRLSRAEAAVRAGAPVAYVVPESGGPLLVLGVALVAGAEGTEAARAFVEWLGTPRASEALADALHRVPAAFVTEPARLGWLPDAATALGGDVPSADTLAAHLDDWIERWKRDARGRGSRIYIP